MANRRIGPFELGEKLGVGGMGIVYRAVYVKTGMPCAIKVLSPDVSENASLQQRFEREINILKKLQHPHIVKYYGGGRVGNQRFYAMELVDGGALSTYLKQKGRLPWREAVQFARQIAVALEHAHDAGVIHRDLKPANLLMTQEGKLKLTDFGIARDTTATALTAAGKTVGTYAYMSPEQIRGKPPVDRRTDLYALGCVLFEMLTGETPFTGDNPGDLLVKHLQEEPPRVTSLAPDCPPMLEDLVFRLLEKDPQDRPYDALAVQVTLDEIVEQSTVHGAGSEAEGCDATAVGGKTQGATRGAASLPTAVQKAATRRKKKASRRTSLPFYENVWFLVGTLVLLVLLSYGIYWWRHREEYLFVHAARLMASEDETQWITARDYYLKPLLARYPKGKRAAQAQEYLEHIELTFLDRQARNRAMRNQPPKSEAERIYVQALEFERFGDRLSAMQRYESLIDLFKEEAGTEGLFVKLARQQLQKIREAGELPTQVTAVVAAALDRAEQLDRSGKAAQRIEARNIWSSIVQLYADNQELADYVAQAQERLNRKRVAGGDGDSRGSQ